MLCNATVAALQSPGRWATCGEGGPKRRACGCAVRVAFSALLLVASASTAQAQCVNVRDTGAAGDGMKDDTVAIQTALDSAIVARRGRTVCLPAGDYRVTRTIVVDDVIGIRLIGEGGATRLIWGGDDRSPRLLLSSVQDAEVRGFQIIAVASQPLDVAIQCITRSGAVYTSRHNMFVNLRIDGITRGVWKGFQVGGAPGIDANNDFHLFENVIVANYANIAYSIENTQVYGLIFVNCLFLGNRSGQIGVATDQNVGKGGTFSWIGGGGGNNQVVDFSLGDPNSGAISITNAISEKSDRFLRTGGPSGASFLLEISGVRWSGDALVEDGIAIDFRFPGPFTIRNSRIGEDSTKALKIRWGPGGTTPGLFVFEGNTVRRAPTAPLFIHTQPTRATDNIIVN